MIRLIAFLICGSFLFSCGMKLDLRKRKYTKGFYVSRSGNHHYNHTVTFEKKVPAPDEAETISATEPVKKEEFVLKEEKVVSQNHSKKIFKEILVPKASKFLQAEEDHATELLLKWMPEKKTEHKLKKRGTLIQDYQTGALILSCLFLLLFVLFYKQLTTLSFSGGISPVAIALGIILFMVLCVVIGRAINRVY